MIKILTYYKNASNDWGSKDQALFLLKKKYEKKYYEVNNGFNQNNRIKENQV